MSIQFELTQYFGHEIKGKSLNNEEHLTRVWRESVGSYDAIES